MRHQTIKKKYLATSVTQKSDTLNSKRQIFISPPVSPVYNTPLK